MYANRKDCYCENANPPAGYENNEQKKEFCQKIRVDNIKAVEDHHRASILVTQQKMNTVEQERQAATEIFKRDRKQAEYTRLEAWVSTLQMMWEVQVSE